MDAGPSPVERTGDGAAGRRCRPFAWALIRGVDALPTQAQQYVMTTL